MHFRYRRIKCMQRLYFYALNCNLRRLPQETRKIAVNVRAESGMNCTKAQHYTNELMLMGNYKDFVCDCHFCVIAKSFSATFKNFLKFLSEKSLQSFQKYLYPWAAFLNLYLCLLWLKTAHIPSKQFPFTPSSCWCLCKNRRPPRNQIKWCAPIKFHFLVRNIHLCPWQG